MESSPVSSAGSTTRMLSERGLGSMKSEDFFKLLITEMRQQDPLEPSKTSDMIGQVSQIRSIELSGQLTDTLDQLTRQQRTSGASEMIGKYVVAASTAADGSEQLIEGIVSAVRFNSDGSAVLELEDGQAVPATDVMHITTVEEAQRRLEEALAAGADTSKTVQKPTWNAAARQKQPWWKPGALWRT